MPDRPDDSRDVRFYRPPDDLSAYGEREPLVPSLTPKPERVDATPGGASRAGEPREPSGSRRSSSAHDGVPRTHPGSDSSAIISSAPRPGRHRARRGDVIGGRYVVDGPIGRGGMGRVLKVLHQVLDKPFALKLLRAPMATDPRVREMFYREARLASSLSHPNICTVLDFGLDPAFGLFMVMELLSGHTLFHRVCHRGKLAPRVAFDVMWQVADALHYIHSRAIVHGDVKSENIFLIRTPSRQRLVKLLDFGLARVDVPRLVSSVEGTPEYLAPERIRGAPPSQRSDIYALGIVFWELLCGERPFSGTEEEVFHHHLGSALPPASARAGEPLDERADAIIARATAKDPELRHPDIASFMYELRTLMSMMGMDVSRRRAGAGDRTTSRPAARVRPAGAAFDAFDHAPVPLATVDTAGKVRVANRAFWAFLGRAGGADVHLSETVFPEVYPALFGDLRRAAVAQRGVKHAIRIPDGAGASVEVAVVLAPIPPGAGTSAGDVIVTVHPLARSTAGR